MPRPGRRIDMQPASRSQPEYSDEQLVERVACQDAVAFTMLYDRYAQPVHTLAVHLVVEEAE